MKGLSKLLALVVISLCLQGLAWAQADFAFKKLTPSFGSADRFGYAMWAEPLARIDLNGKEIPLHLVFSTDPRFPVGALGRGWKLPFFESSLVEESQTTLRWLRPDTVITRFITQRGEAAAESNKGLDVLVSMDGGWQARRIKGGRQVILVHAKSGAELIYEDGVLVRFCLVKPEQQVDRYAISYNRLRKPTRLSVLSTGKPLVEFVYEDGRLAKEVRIGEAVIAFLYAEASLNQFPVGPYLSRISSAGSQPASASASSITPLSITYQVEGGDANRVRFERLVEDGGNTGLVWNATSGFLREDDGAIYKIENPSLVNGGRPVVDPKAKVPVSQADRSKESQVMSYNWRPDEAKVTRTDREGKSEFLHYDRAKGVSTRMNKEGLTTKTYYLVTQGPMMNKVRKVEEIRDGKATVIERNAFDERGRLVRQITKDGLISVWDYSVTGDRVTKYLDGAMVEERIYELGNLSAVKSYNAGVVAEYRYAYVDGLRVMSYFEGGEMKWRRTFNGSKTLKFEVPVDSGGFSEFLFDEKGAPLVRGVLNEFRGESSGI